MDALADILAIDSTAFFTGRVAFIASDDAEAFLAQVPAKPCVALLIDVSGGPLQLICTKNLRALLRRRLEAPDATELIVPSKRVDYRAIVGSVAWHRVDGEFEMDLVYIEAARLIFPTHWRQLIPDRAAHFVAIDTAHAHPDFVRVSDVSRDGNTTLFGPFADRAKADRWIETARDAFDLCRYRAILAQTPNGRACAYKQMNKCPAPCDGTVPLDHYRAGLASAVEAIRSPALRLAEMTAAMTSHAANQEFEEAGRVKSRYTTLSQLGDGPNRAVRPIDEFAYISVQPGPRKGTAKIFSITADAAIEVVALRDASTAEFEDVCAALERASGDRPAWPRDVFLGAVCFHLTAARSSRRFIARRDLTTSNLQALAADASKSASADGSGEAIRETRLPS